jgi:hypothetical protein
MASHRFMPCHITSYSVIVVATGHQLQSQTGRENINMCVVVDMWVSVSSREVFCMVTDVIITGVLLQSEKRGRHECVVNEQKKTSI